MQQKKTCDSYISACTTDCPQENWLITQFIKNTMRQAEIYIRIHFLHFIHHHSCLTVPTQAIGVYVLQTNNSNIAFLNGNIKNIFVTPQVAVLNSTAGKTINITRIIQITADLSTTGLYVAFRDIGNCLWLFEVTVFYPVCDAISLEFGATLAKIGFPGDTSSGVCFNKMAISLNPLTVMFNATCTVNLISSQTKDQLYTNWTINDNILQQCMCQPGYEFTNSITTSQCQGMYAFVHV